MLDNVWPPIWHLRGSTIRNLDRSERLAGDSSNVSGIQRSNALLQCHKLRLLRHIEVRVKTFARTLAEIIMEDRFGSPWHSDETRLAKSYSEGARCGRSTCGFLGVDEANDTTP